MLEIIQFSEEDFYQWLKVQLEKREFCIGKRTEKEKIKEILYEILFYEQGLTVDDIERFFIPFGQAGYLTARQKFEIILFVLEKDFGSCWWFLQETESDYLITEDDVNELYLQWLNEERVYLSEEEKKEFFIQSITDKLGLDVLEVLNRAAPDGILIGNLCPAYYGQEEAENRIAVCSKGSIICLPFLKMNNKEELIRMIKCLLCKEGKEELTLINPILDFVREDGTCITAVRPPASPDWGIRILYSTARKEANHWRK